GGLCQPGYYCPQESSSQLICPGEFYCGSTGLDAPSGNCSAGFYCISGAKVPNPTDGVTGNVCPAGSYCPSKSQMHTPCPPGTFSNSTQNTALSDCNDCTEGYYCEGGGNTRVTAPCCEGSYCPPRQSVCKPNEYNCTLGHKCPLGSPEPVRCDSGRYQDETGQSSCKVCPAGFFCDNRQAPVVLYNNSTCPVGHYCPEGTTFAQEFPCPVGTFSNTEGLKVKESCSPCPGGFYCDELAQTMYTKKCDSAGYYCRRNSTSQTPDQADNANICPVGHYCPDGTGEPYNCPKGTFGNDTAYKTVDECWNCTAGQHCSTPGQNKPDGPCDPGYYCPPRSSSSKEIECPSGTYCIGGNSEPELCPIGTYQPNTGRTALADCTSCTEGYYCMTRGLSNATAPCKAGWYCPTGSSVPTPRECPIGFHCPEGSSLPKPCSAGFYTNKSGAAACDICPASYFCTPLDLSRNESVGFFPCPRGFYCPAQTGLNWKPCPAGTYSNQTGLSVAGQCVDCDAGWYCGGTNLTAPTARCDPGYYCTSGVSVPKPYIDTYNVTNGTCPEPSFLGQYTGIGNICPPGTYCLLESAQPTPCPAGTYNDKPGQSSCKSCEPGYYCLLGTVNFNNTVCPSGHYCPGGTETSTQYPCPAGTYNRLAGQTNDSSCVNCTAGKYCEGPGNSWPTGDCSGGWYCTGGARTNMTITHGGRCTAGHYCPVGSPAMMPCDGGKYCAVDGLDSPTDDCIAGFYCTLRSSKSDPIDGVTGNICPKGNYCPRGVASPVPCLPGTYNDALQATNSSACIQCTRGKHCNGTGLENPVGCCAGGYFCPPGQASQTPALYPCPAGSKCPECSPEPVRCVSGTYQDQVTKDTCKTCPPRFYCNATYAGVDNYATYPCKAGFYCPSGTQFAEQHPCDVGTFSSTPGLERQDECANCTPGDYCGEPGKTTPTGKCAPGFFCKLGAKTATPNQGLDADVCPAGSFCGEGTFNPAPCPAGTFSNLTGLHNESQCTDCTGGFYCELPGKTEVSGPCQKGHYCPSRSISSTSVICPAGRYCPIQTEMPKLCPRGTFSNNTGLWSDSQCTICTAGSYCGSQGLTEPSGLCRAGFYCPE
ncbi:predicted protein, partial [Nematostella vectensis]